MTGILIFLAVIFTAAIILVGVAMCKSFGSAVENKEKSNTRQGVDEEV